MTPYCRIVQQFENILEALIQQENFTTIEVVAEDVALVAERVSYVIINNKHTVYLKVIIISVL